jgi:hypothetical protein
VKFTSPQRLGSIPSSRKPDRSVKTIVNLIALENRFGHGTTLLESFTTAHGLDRTAQELGTDLF